MLPVGRTKRLSFSFVLHVKMCYTHLYMQSTPRQKNDAIFYWISLIINAVLLLILFLGSNSCTSATPPKQEALIPVEFTVVTETNAADVLAESPNETVEEEEVPPLKEDPPPQPDEPELVPELPPVVPKPDVPPPPPEKKVETKKPEKKAEKPPEKKPEKKPEKPKPKPIVKGKRVGPETQGKKDKTKAATEKAPSEEEIRKRLNAGAVASNKNQVPPNEASRVKGVIQRIFREKCEAAGIEPCGSAVTLTVTFKRRGPPGAIEKIVIQKTSGNRSYDNRVLSACRGVRQIPGISEIFLTSRNYTIEACVLVE